MDRQFPVERIPEPSQRGGALASNDRNDGQLARGTE
jgi:hypothetical protein